MIDKVDLGSIIEGKVVKIKPFGAIIALPNNSHGLVHISHISSEFVQDINEYVAVGDLVKVKVISIDADKSKISLSMKEASKSPENKSAEESRPAYERPKNNFSHSHSDSNSFEDKLKDYLKLSNERQASLNKRNKKR